MKKVFPSHIILFFALIILMLSSCKQPWERRIQGKWKRINVENVNSPYLEYWTFEEDGGPLFIHIDATPMSSEINDTTRYYINARFRKTMIHVENSIVPWYNGDWEIIHLKKSTMMIVRNSPMSSADIQANAGTNLNTKGGLLFREFTKE